MAIFLKRHLNYPSDCVVMFTAKHNDRPATSICTHIHYIEKKKNKQIWKSIRIIDFLWWTTSLCLWRMGTGQNHVLLLLMVYILSSLLLQSCSGSFRSTLFIHCVNLPVCFRFGWEIHMNVIKYSNVLIAEN